MSLAQQSRDYRSPQLVETLYRRYLEAGSRARLAWKRPDLWAAALVSSRLKLADSPEALHLVQGVFRCSRRAILHLVHHIERTLGKAEARETD